MRSILKSYLVSMENLRIYTSPEIEEIGRIVVLGSSLFGMHLTLRIHVGRAVMNSVEHVFG